MSELAVSLSIAFAPADPPPPGDARRFDFGTADSPTMAGWQRVTHLAGYTPTVGYGFVSGGLDSRDRGPGVPGGDHGRMEGDDLTRDFVFARDLTFRVDLPNGEHWCKILTGDFSGAQDATEIYLQGVLVATHAATSGHVETYYFRFSVTDGKLLLRMRGAATYLAILNALEIDGEYLPPNPLKSTHRLDFGPWSVPPPAGYTKTGKTDFYNVQRGYGWLSHRGLPDERDRGGSPLIRDFVFGRENLFRVDVPAGADYDVTVTSCDRAAPYDYKLYLQDRFADDVAILAGQVYERTFRVGAPAGYIRIFMHGGELPSVHGDQTLINALRVDPAGAPSPAPTATLSVDPVTITAGGTATLTWTTTDASLAELDGEPVGLSGAILVRPPETRTYTLTAIGLGGTTTATATLTVLPATPPGGETSPWPEFISTHTDTFHNPAFAYTKHAVRSGVWSDANVWSGGTLPTTGDKVRISDDLIVTYDLLSDARIDAVGFGYGGMLRFATAINTRLRVTHLFGFNGGRLEIGSEAWPISPDVTAEIVINDVPLNPAYDPFQFNNGTVLIDCEVTIHGSPKTCGNVRLAAEPGTAMLQLERSVEGWRAGDTLLLPDSAQLPRAGKMPWEAGYVTHTERLSLVSAVGSVATVLGGVAHPHRGAVSVDGTPHPGLLPHLWNLTRNVVIRSENPAGTRGHILLTGHCAIDIRYTEFRDLGRTTAAPLDNTTGTYGAITHVGTNQVGRYEFHLHHVHGVVAPVWLYQVVGCIFWNTSNPKKSGITVHGSPFGLIEACLTYNHDGTGIWTEDGTEHGVLFEDCAAVTVRAGTTAEGVRLPGLGPGARPFGGGHGAYEGYAWWFRGTGARVRNCIAADSIGGFGFFNTELPSSLTVRTGPDSTATRTINPYGHGIEEFDNNECYSCYEDALTLWDVGTQGHTVVPAASFSNIDNFKAWHHVGKAVVNYRTHRVNLIGLVVRGDYGRTATGGTGIFGPDYLMKDWLIENADIQGVVYGIVLSGLAVNLVIKDSYFANYWNIRNQVRYGSWGTTSGHPELASKRVTIENCRHAPNPYPEHWTRGSLASFFWDINPPDIGGLVQVDLVSPEIIEVVAHNGVSTDSFRLYADEMGRSELLPQTIAANLQLRGSPVAGLTNEANMTTHGVCWGGSLPGPTVTRRPDLRGCFIAGGA